MKTDLAKVLLHPIDDDAPFNIETDASDVALPGILNQNNKFAAFYTRTFDDSKKRLYSFKKDVLVIVDTVRKWKHLLTGSHVTIKTDQRSVSFIFNVKHSTKIKHEKLACWRLELSVFNYDVIYQGWPNCGSFDSCCVCVQCCSVRM